MRNSPFPAPVASVEADAANLIVRHNNGDVDVVRTANITVVEHGADAAAERPDASAVYWIGSVEPTNGEVQDLWYDTTA